MSQHEEPGLFAVLLGDGRPPLAFVAVCVALVVGAASYLVIVGELMPVKWREGSASR